VGLSSWIAAMSSMSTTVMIARANEGIGSMQAQHVSERKF
jgi:hypothetical protein